MISRSIYAYSGVRSRSVDEALSVPREIWSLKRSKYNVKHWDVAAVIFDNEIVVLQMITDGESVPMQKHRRDHVQKTNRLDHGKVEGEHDHGCKC